MIISSTELKQTLKKLSGVKTEQYVFGSHGISARDSDVWVVVASPLSELGSFSLLGKKLTQVANRMSGQVEITRTEQSLVLKSAKARIELEVKDARPQVFPKANENGLTFAGDAAVKFKKSLALAAASVDSQKSRWCGDIVHFESLAMGIEDEFAPGYRLVGTDEKVLTVVSEPGGSFPQFSHLLSLAACGFVQIMEGEIRFREAGTCTLIQSPGLDVYASKPLKVYQPIERILAVTPILKFSFKPEEWLAAYRTVEPLLEEEEEEDGGARPVTLHFADGVVQFSTSGTGTNGSDESVYDQVEPDPLFDPQEITLVVNADHLSGFLSKVTGEATLAFTAMNKPLKYESGGLQTLTFLRKGSKR